MKTSKRKQLEEAGWQIGSTAEFLEFSEEEEVLVNMKVALAEQVRATRQKKKITQQELAKRIGSSQSRVAKLEIADRSVSMELLIRTLISLGATRAHIGKIVGAQNTQRKAKAKQKQVTKQ